MVAGITHELRWIDEAKMLELCGVPRSTFLGWVKSGMVDQDPAGAYTEEEMLEIVLLSGLRDQLSVQDLATLWPQLRAGNRVAEFLGRARSLGPADRFDLVVEPTHGNVTATGTDEELATAVRRPGPPRPVVVLDLASRLLLAREDFSRWARRGKRPQGRRVGRPTRRVAEVTELRSS
jgi:hypothetical protein